MYFISKKPSRSRVVKLVAVAIITTLTAGAAVLAKPKLEHLLDKANVAKWLRYKRTARLAAMATPYGKAPSPLATMHLDEPDLTGKARVTELLEKAVMAAANPTGRADLDTAGHGNLKAESES